MHRGGRPGHASLSSPLGAMDRTPEELKPETVTDDSLLGGTEGDAEVSDFKSSVMFDFPHIYDLYTFKTSSLSVK